MQACDASQCSKLFSSKWKLMNTGLGVLLPLSISGLSYLTLKPLTEKTAEVQNCDKIGDMRRSIKAFNVLCLIASLAALCIQGIMELVDIRLLKIGDVKVMADTRRHMHQAAAALKVCIYIALVVSALTALGTYQTCKKQVAAAARKQQQQQQKNK